MLALLFQPGVEPMTTLLGVQCSIHWAGRKLAICIHCARKVLILYFWDHPNLPLHLKVMSVLQTRTRCYLFALWDQERVYTWSQVIDHLIQGGNKREAGRGGRPPPNILADLFSNSHSCKVCCISKHLLAILRKSCYFTGNSRDCPRLVFFFLTFSPR